MLNAGYVLDNRYEIEDKIGQGGMSYVYRAQDKKLGRVVAIKVLKEEFSEDEEFIRKFKNEAKAAAKLAHPNIVGAYDVVDEGELHYIVMELVEGITLKNYIARKGSLSNKETIGIALQAAEGIGEAHKKGIVHRDIKPQNMIISKDGKVKVADFGIAKAVTGETVNAAVIGSVHYISPEQARSGVSDMRSDLYSLGISMYEMITGRVPYEGENTVNVVMAHLSEAMVPPAVYNQEIYPALNDIILKACRKKPDERYQSAAELIADLKRCVREPEGHFVSYGESKGNGEEQPLGSGASAPAEGGTGTASSGDSGNGSSGGDESSHALTELSKGETPPEDGIQRLMKLGSIAAGVILLVIALMIIAKISGLFNAYSPAPTEPVSETSAETADESTTSVIEVNIVGEDLMPDLIGKTVAEASAELALMQVSLDSSKTDFSDTYVEGRIIEQDPEPEEAIIPGITVYVTVSLGKKVNYILNGLSGKTVEEAQEALSEVNVTVAETEREYSDTVEKGRVIGWTPSGENGDTNVEEGGSIVLILSDGKAAAEVRVPSLLNLTQDDARKTLSENGLSAGTFSVRSSDIEAGRVIEQSVAANTAVKRGTAIDLVLSSGPDVLGAADAAQQATLAGPGATLQTDGPGAGGTANGGSLREYYYGSIDEISHAGVASGPGAEGEYINILIQLKQRGPEGTEYATISDLGPVPAGTEFPVSFPSIKGIYGVDSGEVQVINADTGEVLESFTVAFVPR